MDRLGAQGKIHEKMQRKVRCLFGDRAQTERRRKWRSSSTERQRKDGGFQRTQRQSPKKQQAVRIVSTHQEESLLQSTATWEQLWERKKGAIDSITGSEGRVAQAWVTDTGGLRFFSVYFWYLEGWTPRNEALLEAVLLHASTTRHPWLIACDANMCPEDFKKSL